MVDFIIIICTILRIIDLCCVLHVIELALEKGVVEVCSCDRNDTKDTFLGLFRQKVVVRVLCLLKETVIRTTYPFILSYSSLLYYCRLYISIIAMMKIYYCYTALCIYLSFQEENIFTDQTPYFGIRMFRLQFGISSQTFQFYDACTFYNDGTCCF